MVISSAREGIPRSVQVSKPGLVLIRFTKKSLASFPTSTGSHFFSDKPQVVSYYLASFGWMTAVGFATKHPGRVGWAMPLCFSASRIENGVVAICLESVEERHAQQGNNH